MGSRLFIVAAAALAASAPPAYADIYALTDDDGTVRFSNQPDDPRYILYLREAPENPALHNLRNPGDTHLRWRWARKLEPGLYDNPLLANKPYRDDVIRAAKTHRLDPALVHAVIAAESNYNPNAVSVKGAIGLMQIMPDTARRYGVNEKELRLPARNITAGARYLADLIRMFDGDLALALAGYNAGENVVVRYGNKIPPYPETQNYVPRVLRFYADLQRP